MRRKPVRHRIIRNYPTSWYAWSCVMRRRILAKKNFLGKQHVFRYFSVRLRRREGEKRKTPYGGSTRVLGEPAAVLYRLGSIINHWNSRNKKSRGFSATIITTERAAEKEKTSFAMRDCGSLLRKRFDEAMQKRSRSLGSFRARIPLIGLCGVGCRDTDARASLRCAMRAGAGSARRPSSARGASPRRRRTPQTGSATQPVPPPPGAPCVPSSLKEEGLLTRIRN